MTSKTVVVPMTKWFRLLRSFQVCAAVESSLGLLANDCRALADYAVRFRYPGMDATRQQARNAHVATKRIRLAVRGLIK